MARKKQRPAVRAKGRRARMSKGSDMSRAEVSILGKMATLDPETPRYRTLEAALAFKSSWIILGEHLTEVLRTGLWKGWGFASFERYCTDEIHVTPVTAKKLVRSFQWLDEEAPELVPRINEHGRVAVPRSPPEDALPDLGAVTVLAEAKRHVDAQRVPEDAYLALKQAALDGEAASVLRRTLKGAMPVQKIDKVRHLRQALTACVKVIDGLREWDGDDVDMLLVEAERLRDAIAVRLPRVEPTAPKTAAAE